MKFKRNKKASFQDLIFIVIALFVFSLAVLFGTKIYTEIDNNFQASTALPAESKSASSNIKSSWIGSVDNMFLLLLVILSVGTLMLAAFVRIHPLFIPLFFLAWIFLIFITAVFANVFEGVSTHSQMASTTAEFTFMNNVMLFLPFIIGVIGIILMIVMYKLWSVQ